MGSSLQDVVAFWPCTTTAGAASRGCLLSCWGTACVCRGQLPVCVLGRESPSGRRLLAPSAQPMAVMAQVHRYDPRFHVWTAVPLCGSTGPFLVRRRGRGAPGRQGAWARAAKRWPVEMYDLRRDRWTTAGRYAGSARPRGHFVGDRGVVYISGGKGGERQRPHGTASGT